MRDSENSLVCTSHEHREATFVCQHLGTGGVGLGFHRGINPDDPDERWPVAWCDACDAELESEGEWSERVMELADLRLLCAEHYDLVRCRNWRQSDVAYAKLSRLAMAYLQKRQSDLHERFPFGACGSFSLDKHARQIVFSGQSSKSVVANFQIVGVLSDRDETWTWSWASPSEPESVKEQMRVVRAYGEAHSYRQLVSAVWPAEEADGWAMTAIAAYLLDAEGANRISHQDGAMFLVLNGVRWVG